LGGLVASAFQPTGDLPPFLMAQMLFPYTAGEAFVGRLLEVGRGGWSVVDAALRHRPPASTEQVLHPDAYLRVQVPLRVSLRGPTAALGGGWTRRDAGTMGEWLTGRLLARAGGTGADPAAAGWGGDRYALLARGSERALVARWRWDTRRDEVQFVRALRMWAREGLSDGAAAIGRRRRAVTLVLAPDLGLARRAARAGD
jgi:hypothetical protein